MAHRHAAWRRRLRLWPQDPPAWAFVADAFQEELLCTADDDRLCIGLGVNIGGDEPTAWEARPRE